MLDNEDIFLVGGPMYFTEIPHSRMVAILFIVYYYLVDVLENLPREWLDLLGTKRLYID